MWKLAVVAIASALVLCGAQQSGASQGQATEDAAVECKFVVSADPGAKPTKLCLTKTQWAAKSKLDAKDPNRIVCHYEEEPGTRFASRKICMPAAQWDDRKLQDRQDIERIQLQSAGRGP